MRLRVLLLTILGGLALLLGSLAGGGEGAPRRVAAEPPPTRGSALPAAEIPQLLEALSGSSARAAERAIERILAARDLRFTAVFIELMRAAEIGIAAEPVFAASVAALEALHGKEIGSDWHAWVIWYAGTELEPPPGFLGWKGALLGRIDPSFARLLAPDAPSRIRVEEIVWGGVPFEGIPALDRPAHVAAGRADYLGADEPVFGILLGGEARAYPLRILDWHEMVNDRLGGVDFSIAYCTLCGSGIAYRALASNGQRYDFGSSGFLMRSNKLMVDRQTRSLWNHLSGRPVLGSLAASDLRLERLPLVVTRWGDWRRLHPETRVLSLETGFERPYRPGAAYAGYFASPETMFPVRQRSGLLPRKARIFGLEVEGVPKAYPLDRLVQERVVNDRVNQAAVTLVAAPSAIRVEGVSVRSGAARYTAGAAVRAYRTDGVALHLEGDTLRDATGQPWRLTEEALVAADGRRAERLPGFLAYWFGWNAYYPGTLVYGEPAAGGP